MTKYRRYTVDELLSLTDSEFIAAMKPTVWKWVHKSTNGLPEDIKEEAFWIAMSVTCSKRALYDKSKNKAFIPWAHLYARAAIQKAVETYGAPVYVSATSRRRIQNAKSVRDAKLSEYDFNMLPAVSDKPDYEQLMAQLSDSQVLCNTYHLTQQQVSGLQASLKRRLPVAPEIQDLLKPWRQQILDL